LKGHATVRPGILTLTTDFGADGPYVAQIKGVVLGLAPGTQIVDVSHAIGPQDIAEGAFVLAEVVEAFPSGTVHLAVVDPGVGTERRLIVVEARDQWFVLPDNGLIGEVLRDHGSSGAWEIRNPDLRRADVSSTFHGRDILAPVAAHLLRGGDPADVGPRLFDAEPTPPSVREADRRRLAGEVVFVDAFGNLITSIRREALAGDDPAAWQVEILGRTIDGPVATYGERPPGSLVALIGSSGRLEVAVVNGDASKRLLAARGTPVVLHRGGMGN
jgi:S-adenosylmethionine hydrolase